MFFYQMTTRMRPLLALSLLGLALVACGGGAKQDFEEAEFYIGVGGVNSGEKAERLLTPYLSSTDLVTKLKAHRLLIGAKIAQGGFDFPRILSRIAERDDSDDTIEMLANAFSSISDGAATRAQLTEAFSQTDSLLATAEFQGIANNETTEAGKEKLAIFQGYGFARFLYALTIATVDSGLVTATTATVCNSSDGLLGADADGQVLLNSLGDDLRRARIMFINANLDDSEQKAQMGPLTLNDRTEATPVFIDVGSPDPDNNPFTDMIHKIQESLDQNFNGVIDGGQNQVGDDATTNDKAREVCDYLELRESE